LFKKISAGQAHACGVTTGDKVYCWGNNGSGRLGNNLQTSTTVPILIDDEVTYKDIAAGGSHTCGITSSDDVKCWGSGYFGQLGTGSYPTFIPIPTLAAGGLKFKSITAGLNHTCALTLADDLYCWGYNIDGQLGTSDFTSQNAPTQVSGVTKYRQISAGAAHTCAITLNGQESQCWGNNQHGQLGTGGFIKQSSPQKIRDQSYPMPITEQKMFMGGGGGGGDQSGGAGGGIILIFAKEIFGSGTISINTSGNNGMGSTLGGGGGGGGTIGIASRRIQVSSLILSAIGGSGTTSLSSGGGGGGGGAIEVRRCNAQSTSTPGVNVNGGAGTGTAFSGAYGIKKLENLESLCNLD
jgi:hypothetical protein